MLEEAGGRARQGLILLETFFRGSLEEGLQAPYRWGLRSKLEFYVFILETTSFNMRTLARVLCRQPADWDQSSQPHDEAGNQTISRNTHS